MCSNPIKHGREVWQISDTQNQQPQHYGLNLITDNFLCRGSHYIALVVLWHIIYNEQLRSK